MKQVARICFKHWLKQSNVLFLIGGQSNNTDIFVAAPERAGDRPPSAMSVSTVGAILRRLGLGRLAALEAKPPAVRYERQWPGEMIHLDTKKLGRIAAIGHRITGRAAGMVNCHHGIGWEALHVCIDDATRLAAARRCGPTRATRDPCLID